MSAFATFRLVQTKPTTEHIFVNEEEIHGVRHCEISYEPNELPKVHLELSPTMSEIKHDSIISSTFDIMTFKESIEVLRFMCKIDDAYRDILIKSVYSTLTDLEDKNVCNYDRANAIIDGILEVGHCSDI